MATFCDALIFGAVTALPLIVLREGRRAVTKGARLQGNGSQRFGTVTHRDLVPSPPRAPGDG